MNQFELYGKCVQVVDSVGTFHHLKYAAKFLRLAIRYADKNNLAFASESIRGIRYGSRMAYTIDSDGSLI